MAGAVPNPTFDAAPLGRPSAAAPAWARLRGARWLAALLLALATLAGMLAAYSVRPYVAIDIGDYLDRPYLPLTFNQPESTADFYAPEVGPIGADEPTDWPADRAAIDLPGKRSGTWRITVLAADGPDSRSLKGTRSRSMACGYGSRAAARATGAGDPARAGRCRYAAAAARAGLVGDPMPPAGTVGQVRLAPARTFRWTSARSVISLPGIGRGDWQVALTAVLKHPDGTPLDATIVANGTPLVRLPDSDRRQISFVVPAALVPDGDLTIELRSNTYSDPRRLGMLLYDVRVAPAGPGQPLPPLRFVLYALLIALSLYWCLARIAALPGRRRRVGSCAGGRMGAGGGALPNRVHAATAGAAGDLECAAAAGAQAAAGLGVRAGRGGAERLAAARAAAGVLRGLLDQSRRALPIFCGHRHGAADAVGQAHLQRRVLDLLRHRQPHERANHADSRVGREPAGDPLLAMVPSWPGCSCCCHADGAGRAYVQRAGRLQPRVTPIALLRPQGRLSEREALFAGTLYAVTPATFLLHSWGNLPTTFGIWMTLLSTVYLVAAYRRLDQRGPFVVLLLLLTATMLIYTVMAVFP
ncbi:MAG: hypothetical protein U0Z44_05360 [Kouleothrix sp.]